MQPNKQPKTPQKNKLDYKQFKFSKCEMCGEYPAIKRHWNLKILCSDCALKDFKKYVFALLAGAGVVLILMLI